MKSKVEKLSDKQVKQIRVYFDIQKLSVAEISELTGVSELVVSSVVDSRIHRKEEPTGLMQMFGGAK